MTIESQLSALTAQTLELDNTIQTELADVNSDISEIRTRVTQLEISGGSGSGGGSGGGGSGGGTDPVTGAVEIVESLPTTGNFEGRIVFFNNVLYVWDGSSWKDSKTVLANDAPAAIVVVSSLPTTGTEGEVIFNRSNGYIYQRVNGIWAQVVVQVNTSTTVADASLTVAKFAAGLRPVEIFASLPTVGNVSGRLVFLTSDNKLYRYDGTNFINKIGTEDLTGTIGADQIAANAITTGKIAAGAITASQIAAEAVNAGKIAAGSITADKLTANSVTADKVATNAITASKIEANAVTAGKVAAGAIGTDQLQANSVSATILAAGAVVAGKIAAGAVSANNITAGAITAEKILAGAVTADKLAAGTSTIASGISFSLGQGASINGLQGAIAAETTSGTKTAFVAVSKAAIAAAYMGTSSSTNYAAEFYNSTSTSFTAHRTLAALAYGNMAGYFLNQITAKGAEIGNSVYGVYTYGGVGPFTGSHDALIPNGVSMTPGDIVVDTSVAAKATISDVITHVSLSSSVSQKSVLGVYVADSDSRVPFSMGEFEGKDLVAKPEFASVLSANKVILVNSVGEGQINVCGEGGNIEIGDLIVTSSIPGKGMKQSDDLVRSCTVAKAREAVTFSSPTEVKQIACTYHAG